MSKKEIIEMFRSLLIWGARAFLFSSMLFIVIKTVNQTDSWHGYIEGVTIFTLINLFIGIRVEYQYIKIRRSDSNKAPEDEQDSGDKDKLIQAKAFVRSMKKKK